MVVHSWRGTGRKDTAWREKNKSGPLPFLFRKRPFSVKRLPPPFPPLSRAQKIKRKKKKRSNGLTFLSAFFPLVWEGERLGVLSFLYSLLCPGQAESTRSLILGVGRGQIGLEGAPDNGVPVIPLPPPCPPLCAFRRTLSDKSVGITLERGMCPMDVGALVYHRRF